MRLPQPAPGSDPAWHLYVVRDESVDFLASALKEGGIGHKVYYRVPAHRQPAMAEWGARAELPVTDELARTHVAIPMSPVLSAEQAVPLPSNISMEAGACLGIPAYTAYQAVVLTGIGAGATVLVAAGAGAVGHYAIQFAKKNKATVITTVSSPQKAALAREAGADHTIDYKREDVGERVTAITGKRGVDAVIEMDLGVNAKLLPGVLKPTGVVAIYGSGTPEVAIPFQFLLQNSIDLKFFLVYLMPPDLRARATADITHMLERGELIHNVAQTFDLGDIVAAHEAVEAGTAMGNIVVRIA